MNNKLCQQTNYLLGVQLFQDRIGKLNCNTLATFYKDVIILDMPVHQDCKLLLEARQPYQGKKLGSSVQHCFDI